MPEEREPMPGSGRHEAGPGTATRPGGAEGDPEPGPPVEGPPWYRRRAALWLFVPLAALLIGILVVAVAFWRIYEGADIPEFEDLAIPDPTVVLDRDGEQVETFELAAVRRNVSLDDLQDHTWQAVLAAEDRQFYEHRGFSMRGIARAAWVNLTSRERRQGASTINQQYVSLAVSDIGSGYLDKFREAAIAARLDDEFSKDRILEMYLNAVPLGRQAIGIEAGAQTYFDRPAAELNLHQSAVLAGMIAAPSAFDPARNPEGAIQRRNFVLQGMVEIGAIDAERAQEVMDADLPELRTDPLVTFGADAYFLDTVRSVVPDLVDEGEHPDLATGLVISTTLDRRAQRLAHEALGEHLGELPHTGSIVTVEPGTGAVRVLLGGKDFEQEQFNVATRGERGPGSAFKTFVLTEFVDQGYHPDATRVDAPREYRVPDDPDNTVIGNYSGRGHGEVSVRQATVESINTAYVQLGEDLGLENVVAQAEQLGVTGELPPVPSIVLGPGGVSTVDMAVAYATLAAEGVRARPYLVERIETQDGEVLFEHEVEDEEVLEPNVARVVTDVLVDVVQRGTGTAADIGRPVAGKTGTTNDSRDAWFVGYTPDLVTAVWVGNSDFSPMDGVTGGSLPAPIWASYMGELLEGTDVSSFAAPDLSGLQPLTGLEAPEPEPEPTPEREDAREEEDDEDDEEDDEEEEEDEDEDEDEEDDEDDEDRGPPDDEEDDEDDGPGEGEGQGEGRGGGNDRDEESDGETEE